MSAKRFLKIVLAISAIVCAAARLSAEPPAAALLDLHVQEAKSYRIYRDEAQKDRLELNEKPIFNWTNLVGEHPQYGHLFLWTKNGRPEVIGTMFSTRTSDSAKRKLVHEFHTLSPQKLFPVTPASSAYQWKPEKGISLIVAEEAPPPAETAAQRLGQMRNLARTYAAETRSQQGRTWQLRLLTSPLWRYDVGGDDVLDGALFAMVSSAGTDPEIILVVEARRRSETDRSWAWHTAAARFSDQDIIVQRDGKPLWSSLTELSYRAEIKNQYTLIETRDKTYSCYTARVIDELPEAAK